jgi:osmotically-inducible protein OsmY
MLDKVPAQLSSVMARPYEVATASRSDFHIRRDVRVRMSELGFAHRQIHVFIISGRVTLHGRVRSWAEAQRAVAAARNVRGVRMVVNNLNVSRHTAR